MLIFPTQTVDDVKTHFLFWYLPVTFCSCSAKVKAFSLLHHQLSLLFVSYYVHMCVWHSVHVYVDSSMNIQSRGKCLLSCSITLHLFSQNTCTSLQLDLHCQLKLRGSHQSSYICPWQHWVYKCTWPHPCFLCECGDLNSGTYAYKRTYSPSLSHLSSLVSSTDIFIISIYTYFISSHKYIYISINIYIYLKLCSSLLATFFLLEDSYTT